MKINVCALLLLTSAAAAQESQPARFAQRSPQIAFSGNMHLVVWCDYRRTEDFAFDLFASRIDTAGRVLDPNGIKVMDCGYQTLSAPAVAALGAQFLVAWTRGANVYARRVGADGSLIDRDPIAIRTTDTSDPYVSSQVTASSDGTNFSLAWTDYRNGSEPDIYGARISPEGTVLDSGGRGIVVAQGVQFYPRICNGYIVWLQYRPPDASTRVYGARLGADLSVLESNGVPISDAFLEQRAAAVASSGNGFLAVWPQGGDIYSATISASGLPSMPVQISSHPASETSPQVIYSNAGYDVVWQREPGAIVGARIAEGNVIQPATLLEGNSTNRYVQPALAARYLAWTKEESSWIASDIYGGGLVDARVDQQTLVSSTVPSSFAPDISEIRRVADGIRVRWTTLPGRTYRLEYASGFRSSGWITFPTNIYATETSATYTDRGLAPLRFYRVRQTD